VPYKSEQAQQTALREAGEARAAPPLLIRSHPPRTRQRGRTGKRALLWKKAGFCNGWRNCAQLTADCVR
jgi:hypothetical protein